MSMIQDPDLADVLSTAGAADQHQQAGMAAHAATCGQWPWQRTAGNGCTVTDAVPTLLMACIIFSVWLRKTSRRMVLFLVHVVSARIRMITLPQKPFTSTCCSPVSCPVIIVGPSTEKEGL